MTKKNNLSLCFIMHLKLLQWTHCIIQKSVKNAQLIIILYEAHISSFKRKTVKEHR